MDDTENYCPASKRIILGEGEVVEKFRDLTKGLVKDPTAEAVVERVMSVEDLSDVNGLLSGF